MDIQQVQALLSDPRAGGSNGKLMLVDGTVLDGTWVCDLTNRMVELTDNTGVLWRIDLSQIMAFSPMPPPSPQIPPQPA